MCGSVKIRMNLANILMPLLLRFGRNLSFCLVTIDWRGHNEHFYANDEMSTFKIVVYMCSPVIRYVGGNGAAQNCMSARFNGAGTHILALRRRLSPVLYAVQSPEPVAEFYHQV